MVQSLPTVIGIISGLLLCIIIVYFLYNRGLFSALTFNRITRGEEIELLPKMTNNIKESFFAISGEYPSSTWSASVANNLINSANLGKKIELVGGEVICMGSEKTKNFYSDFLKKVITNEKIYFYKKEGNKIRKHIDEVHFRVVDGGKFCTFHKHDKRGYDAEHISDKNCSWIANKFINDANLNNLEKFDLKSAEKENSLVIELKQPGENDYRYRKATPDEIIGFKEYLEN